MNSNNNDSDKLNSSVLKYQALETEFNLAMKQYEEAHLNYINSLNSTQRNFITYPDKYNRPYPDTNRTTTENEEECKALCSNDVNCSVSNYVASNGLCIIGKNTWMHDEPGTSCSVLDTANYSTLISELNNQLTLLVERMNDERVKMSPEAQHEVILKDKSKTKLQEVHQKLKEDRFLIDKRTTELEKINHELEDSSIYVNQSDSVYRLCVIFALLLIIYTGKSIMFPDLDSMIFRAMFWIIMSVLFIVTTTKLHNITGFSLWGIILILIFLIHSNVIPKP